MKEWLSIVKKRNELGRRDTELGYRYVCQPLIRICKKFPITSLCEVNQPKKCLNRHIFSLRLTRLEMKHAELELEMRKLLSK